MFMFSLSHLFWKNKPGKDAGGTDWTTGFQPVKDPELKYDQYIKVKLSIA